MEAVEKRRAPRLTLDSVTVEVYLPEQSTADHLELSEICSVGNISEGGLMFAGEKNYEKGQILRLTFLLPDSIIIIRADAVVVYSKSHKNSFQVGVYFKDLCLTDQKLIHYFIEKNNPNAYSGMSYESYVY